MLCIDAFIPVVTTLDAKSCRFCRHSSVSRHLAVETLVPETSTPRTGSLRTYGNADHGRAESRRPRHRVSSTSRQKSVTDHEAEAGTSNLRHHATTLQLPTTQVEPPEPVAVCEPLPKASSLDVTRRLIDPAAPWNTQTSPPLANTFLKAENYRIAWGSCRFPLSGSG